MSARGISASSGITVYEPVTRKMLTGLSAPNEKALIPWIKEHKSWRVFVPSGKGKRYNVIYMYVHVYRVGWPSKIFNPPFPVLKTGHSVFYFSLFF